MIDYFLEDSLPSEVAAPFSSALEYLYKHLNSVVKESKPQRGEHTVLPRIRDLFGDRLVDIKDNPCIYLLAYVYEFLRIQTLGSSNKAEDPEHAILHLERSLSTLDLNSSKQALFFLERPKALSYLIYAVLITQNNKSIENILNHAQGFPLYEQLRWFAGFVLKINIPFEDTSYHHQFMRPFKEINQLPLVEPNQGFTETLIHPIDFMFSLFQIDKELAQSFPDPIILKSMAPNTQLFRALFQLQGAISLLIVFTNLQRWSSLYERMNAAALCFYQRSIELNGGAIVLAINHSEYLEHLMKQSLRYLMKYPNNPECVSIVLRYLELYSPKSLDSIVCLQKNLGPLIQIFLYHGLYEQAYHFGNEVELLYRQCANFTNPELIGSQFPNIITIQDQSKAKLHIKELKWYSLYLYLLDNLVHKRMTIDEAMAHPDFENTYTPYKELKHKAEGSYISILIWDNLIKLAAMKVDPSTHVKVCRFYEYIKPGLTAKEIKGLDERFSLVDGLMQGMDQKKRVKSSRKKGSIGPQSHTKSTSAKPKASSKKSERTSQEQPLPPELTKEKKSKSLPILVPSSIETAEDNGEEFVLQKQKGKRKKKEEAEKKQPNRAQNIPHKIKPHSTQTKSHKDDYPHFFSSNQKSNTQGKPIKETALDRTVELPDDLVAFLSPFFNGWTRFYLTGGAVFELKMQKEPFDYDVLAIGVSHGELINKLKKRGLEPTSQGKIHPIIKVRLPSGKDVEISCIEKTPLDPIQILQKDYKTRDLKNSALYLPIREERKQEIIDFEGSLQCCLDGILQSVSSPLESWGEDILRLIRLVKWKLKFPQMEFSAEIQQVLNDPKVSILGLFREHQHQGSILRGRMRTALDNLFERFGVQAVTKTLFESGILHPLLACTKEELALKLEIIEMKRQTTSSDSPILDWLIALHDAFKKEDEPLCSLPLMSLIYLKPEELRLMRELSENDLRSLRLQ